MNPTIPDARAVLKLYKQMLRYSNSLKYTDKEFYMQKIRNEFIKQRELTEPQEITFQYQVLRKSRFPSNNSISGGPMFQSNMFYASPAFPSLTFSQKVRDQIDYSRVPVLDEKDLEEGFVKGGGPGGQKVNKSTNCVYIKHLPTGIHLKCHFSRSLIENRKLARLQLIDKLDEHLNGEMSIKSQKERIEKRRSMENEGKRRNLNEMKRKYLEHIRKDSA